LQRARWALDQDELDSLKERAESFGLDETEQFNDFKKKYLNAVENGNLRDIIKTGARNPYGMAADEHEIRYYQLVRSMHTDVSKIAAATGFTEDEIRDIKNYLFVEKHDLGNGGMEQFAPDYMIAQSRQRLVDGKPEPHDITLLEHERYERQLVLQGMTQDKAHIESTHRHNYQKEAQDFYDKIKKYRQE
jgi:hypothetical protein